MTDELNELASAYVDGETTPEESAWVENNDRAQTVIENIQYLSRRVRSIEPQKEAIRESHLTAALTAFDVSASKETVVIDRSNADTTQKVDLQPTIIASVPSVSDSNTNDHQNDGDTSFANLEIQGLVGNVVPISSKPQYRWLASFTGAAALVLIVGAGFTRMASQNNLTSSSDEASSSAVATTVSAVAAKAPRSDRTKMADADDAAEETPEEVDFDGDLPDDEGTSESAEEADPTESSRVKTDLLTFDVLPAKAELEAIGSETVLSTDYGPSSCAANASDADGGTLIGFAPVSVNGTPGELLVFTSETRRRGVSVSVVDSQCRLLS